ncbi:MAG: hypothetical protein NC331_05255 [Lachnospiraceae bacterium]|nr:hypothetical protein [Lachnospiraceae bacterium]MCM1238774.1 hypothetical protein [Lachnospiraceae bacterium]
MNIQINDCTIRDGGYLFKKNSPAEFVSGVMQGLINAGIDIIEVGFLQDAVNGETLVYRNSTEARRFLPVDAEAARFTGFCDNSRYSLENLDGCDGKAFEYLRISFAKHEADAALKFVAGAKAKGYKIFANPMDAPSYTVGELCEMIEKVNRIQPYAFSIVDTFGTMYMEDLKSIFAQVDQRLDKSIRVGLHSHNNLQLSNALAETMIDMAVDADRDIVVDGSLYGMGRGAGNASTEVLAAYLNARHGKDYSISVLFDTIERYISPCLDNEAVDRWGYDLPMLICGMMGSHVDNIFHLKKISSCNSSEILEIISRLDSMKRKRYGSNYSKTDFTDLDEIYTQYGRDRGKIG